MKEGHLQRQLHKSTPISNKHHRIVHKPKRCDSHTTNAAYSECLFNHRRATDMHKMITELAITLRMG